MMDTKALKLRQIVCGVLLKGQIWPDFIFQIFLEIINMTKYNLTIENLTAQDMVDMYNSVSDLQNPRLNCRILEGWLDSLPKDAQEEIRCIRQGHFLGDAN